METRDERGRRVRARGAALGKSQRGGRVALASGLMAAIVIGLGAGCCAFCDRDRDDDSPQVIPFIIDRTLDDPRFPVDAGATPQSAFSNQFIIGWGSLIYFLNQHGQITFQGVAGGPVGSQALPGAAIVVNRNVSHGWHFLTGRQLRVQSNVTPAFVATSDPGDTILSQGITPASPPIDDDKWVTMKLLGVHDIRPQIVHVPLLEGDTWHPSGGSLGATFAEADEILTNLGLTLQSTSTSGRVAQILSPAPGSFATAGTVVEVEFAPDTTPIPALGDDPVSPIAVSTPGIVRGELNLAHHDALPESQYVGLASCFGRGRDVFYKLPASAMGQKVMVSELTEEQVTVSAWKRNTTTGTMTPIPGACSKANPPAANGNLMTSYALVFTGAKVYFEFVAPTDPNTEVLIMVEHDRRDIAMFDLSLEW